MKRIRIVHRTDYDYNQPVAFGPDRAMMRPREGDDVASMSPLRWRASKRRRRRSRAHGRGLRTRSTEWMCRYRLCRYDALCIPGRSVFRLRGEEIQSQPLRQELGDELSFDAVAGVVERWRKCPKAALAGRDGDDAATNPALARQADVVKPIAGSLIQPDGRHHSQSVMAGGRVNHSLPGDWIYSAAGQGGTHHRKVSGAHVQ